MHEKDGVSVVKLVLSYIAVANNSVNTEIVMFSLIAINVEEL